MNKLVCNKNGVWGNFIVYLILGLILLILILVYVFQEAFEDDITWETCRQSIIIRNIIPEVDTTVNIISFKDKFPLKCQTAVVDIKDEKMENTKKIILDTMAQCWYLMGNGNYSIFPSAKWSSTSFCFPCARIHFASNVKDFYKQNPINLQDSLILPFQDKGISYKQYLTAQGYNPFLVENNFADTFKIIEAPLYDWKNPDIKTATIYYPKIIDMEKGDLFITYATWIINDNDVANQLLFYQWDNGEVLKQLTKIKVHDEFSAWRLFAALTPVTLVAYESIVGDTDEIGSACEVWDGMPA